MECDSVEGLEHLDKVINIDQSPIGRTPRSNPATYTGMFYGNTRFVRFHTRRQRTGLKAGRFSFNVAGGRCENCAGDGILKIEMNFLPDVYVPCEVSRQPLQSRNFAGQVQRAKNIADVLDMRVEDALEFSTAFLQ